MDGSADVQGLLPPNLAPLTAGGLAVQATADVLSERITLNNLSLSTAAGSLRGEGAFLPAEKRIDGKVALTLGPPSVLQPLVPGIGYETAAADVLLSGTLPVPNVQLDMLAEDLTSGTLRAGKAALRAKVTAGDAAGEQMPPLDARAELVLSDIVQPSKGLEPLLEQPVRLTLDGRYEPGGKHAIVRQLRLDAGPMQVAGNADLRLAEKLTGTAVLQHERVRSGFVEPAGRYLALREGPAERQPRRGGERRSASPGQGRHRAVRFGDARARDPASVPTRR